MTSKLVASYSDSVYAAQFTSDDYYGRLNKFSIELYFISEGVCF